MIVIFENIVIYGAGDVIFRLGDFGFDFLREYRGEEGVECG